MAANLAHLPPPEEPFEDALAPGEMPPYSSDAEMAVLGGILQDAQAMAQVAPLLTAADFYHEHHRVVYDACLTLFKSGEPVDVVWVSERLADDRRLWDVGGRSYVMQLGAGLPGSVGLVTARTVVWWARLVRDMAQRRALWEAAHAMIETTHDKAIKDPLGQATASLLDIARRFELTGASPSMADAINEALESLISRQTGLVGLSSGLPTLDRMTGGFQSGQLITLGARPGNGKTSLALNIAHHAVGQGLPVLFFSLEMQARELMGRVLRTTAQSSCDPAKLRAAAQAVQQSARLWHIDDTPSLTLAAIQARTMKAFAQPAPPTLVVVDHLGLIASEPGKRAQNRAYELGDMTASLKAMAKTINAPILLLCQLNRAIEARQDRKPQLSDLRDSGSIEQDSDIVLFTDIVRGEDRKPTGEATLSIAKQRDGALGDIPLSFAAHLTRFREPLRL